MSEVTKEIMEQFWQEYEEHIRDTSDGGDYLIEDGIDMNKMDEYMSQEPRILFVFKESNESGTTRKCRKSIFDEKEWFGSFVNDRSDKKGISMCAKMYKFIVAKHNGENVKIRELKVDAKDINNFAYINISKRGNGGKASDDDYIKGIIEKDAAYLRKQIEILNPKVVVVGGKNVSEKYVEEIIEKSSLKDVKLIQIEHFTYLGYESSNNAKEESFVKQCEELFK